MPFAAETCTVSASSLRLSRCFGGSRSILFLTCNVGLSPASSSLSTRSTCASCSADSGLLASETRTIKAARFTSSKVARNEVTNACGRLRMKPTVSDSNTFRLDGRVTERRVGSSVANIRGDSRTVALVSALNRVDLPAFVYPTKATVATGTDSLRCRC